MPLNRPRRKATKTLTTAAETQNVSFKPKVSISEDDVPLKSIQKTMISKATQAARRSVALINATGLINKTQKFVLKDNEEANLESKSSIINLSKDHAPEKRGLKRNLAVPTELCANKEILVQENSNTKWIKVELSKDNKPSATRRYPTRKQQKSISKVKDDTTESLRFNDNDTLDDNVESTEVVISIEIERIETELPSTLEQINKVKQQEEFLEPATNFDENHLSMEVNYESLQCTEMFALLAEFSTPKEYIYKGNIKSPGTPQKNLPILKTKSLLKTPLQHTIRKQTSPPSPPKVSKMESYLPTSFTSYILPTDPLCFEYQQEAMLYFRERELQNPIKSNYLRQQPQIDRAARAFLVNWFVLAVKECNLDTEILYNAVSYLDRLLSGVVVARSKLQIVGVACIHIAAKFDEIRPPKIEKLAAVGNVEWDMKQVLRMEEVILNTLSFDLRQPTVYTFVSAFAMAIKMPDTLRDLTMYICELSLLETEPYLQFLPSKIAAAAHALARYMLAYEIWSYELEDVTTYRLEQLKQIFFCLNRTHAGANKILPRAIQMKYSEREYGQVSSIGSEIIAETLFDNYVESFYSF